MQSNIYSFLLEIISYADLIIIFSVATLLLFAETLTLCLLAKRGKISTQKTFVHLMFSGGLCLALISFTLANASVTDYKGALFLPLLFTAFSLLALIPIKLVKNKPIIKQEQIDLARIIDVEYKCKNPKPVERLAVEPDYSPIDVVGQTAKNSDVDFTHVKNVVERLNYFNLSPSDKRVVGELKNNVALAEQGEFTPELKSKINDGLGFLLKIMSKYKV